MNISIRATTRAFCVLSAAILGSASGCGAEDGLRREAVSGKVTLDGRPLEGGNIQFLPTAGSQDAAGWGTIEGGAYAIPVGPVAGEYSVSITSAAGSASAAGPDELPGEPSDESAAGGIPEIYNLRTTLRATVQAGKPNVFDFALTSKRAPAPARRR